MDRLVTDQQGSNSAGHEPTWSQGPQVPQGQQHGQGTTNSGGVPPQQFAQPSGIPAPSQVNSPGLHASPPPIPRPRPAPQQAMSPVGNLDGSPQGYPYAPVAPAELPKIGRRLRSVLIALGMGDADASRTSPVGSAQGFNQPPPAPLSPPAFHAQQANQLGSPGPDSRQLSAPEQPQSPLPDDAEPLIAAAPNSLVPTAAPVDTAPALVQAPAMRDLGLTGLQPVRIDQPGAPQLWHVNEPLEPAPIAPWGSPIKGENNGS